MIYQWKWLRPRAGSDTGAVMIFQMSMYYLSFAPLWILVFLTDIFSICDNDKYLVTEYISIVLILFFMVIAVRRMRNKLNSKNSDNVKCICLEEVQEEKFLVAEFLMSFIFPMFATVYKGNIIKNLIMDCQSYTKYRPNETTGGIFVSWRRKEELPTGA